MTGNQDAPSKYLVIRRAIPIGMLALGLTLLPLIAFPGVAGAEADPTQPKVIYGADDRIDVYQEIDPLRLQLSRSVALLVDGFELTDNGDGTFELDTTPYSAYMPFCPEEPFLNQPIAGSCTGFLVGDDLLVTAGHCLDPLDFVDQFFVFGFVMEDADNAVTGFEDSQVYRIVEILFRAEVADLDYSIVRVDRTVTAPGAQPLDIRRQGLVDVGTPLMVMGHPTTLPLKIAAGNTSVADNQGAFSFVANLDTYGGNSGSPVFNQVTGVVEGILIAGQEDYSFDAGRDCFLSAQLSDTGDPGDPAVWGELVTKMTSIADLIPEIGGGGGENTLIVDTLSDEDDGDSSNIDDLIEDPGDDDAISLREAILATNNTPGANTILFSVSGVIELDRELPALNDAAGGTVIDGGGVITLDGGNLEEDESGLIITSAGNTVQGLTIVQFPENGILIQGASATDNFVLGCMIGTDGTQALGNRADGVSITSSAANNTIGGRSPEDGNIITGNRQAAISISGGAFGNVIQGNYLGADAGGKAAFGNQGDGITIFGGASNNRVGGAVAAAANLITANGMYGIRASGGTTAGNLFRRNSVHGNVLQGIRLAEDAHGGISPPVITSQNPIGGTAPPDAIVELFADDNGDGETFITLTTADGSGVWSMQADLNPFAGLNLTATATTEAGTSEFSSPLQINLTPPIITLLGAERIQLECGLDVYVEPGATAEDDINGDISGQIVIEILRTGQPVEAVDTSTPSTYTITYDVVNSGGIAAETLTRTVVVADTAPPVIIPAGDLQVIIDLGATYEDAGASAIDACDPNLPPVTIDPSGVDTSVPGIYNVVFTVMDASGNEGISSRGVTVVDVLSPVLTLLGDPDVTIECGDPYEDAGATALDDVDGDLTAGIIVTGTVVPGQTGTYTLVYDVRDAARNNAESVLRTVTVQDTLAPEISIIGDNPMMLFRGQSYFEPGATATDVCDGTLDVTIAGTVDTTQPGRNEVRYTATDAAGNTTTRTRLVIVELDESALDACLTGCAGATVDADLDGLTACIEDCLGTSDAQIDTDVDGIPDSFEFQFATNPLLSNAGVDSDGDSLSDLEEFLLQSDPKDPNSPYRTFYVAPPPVGQNSPDRGGINKPWSRISYALAQAASSEKAPSEEAPVRIVAQTGTYPEDIVLQPWMSVAGAVDSEVVVLGQAIGADNSALVNLELTAFDDIEFLLAIQDAAMDILDVTFSDNRLDEFGEPLRMATGILAGGAVRDTLIEDCLFTGLATGVDIGGAIPTIRRCVFENLSGDGIILRETAFVFTPEPDQKTLGDSADSASGWNTFAADIAGFAVFNDTDELMRMQNNDWGSNDPESIAARIFGPSDFEPFLPAGTGVLAAKIACTVWSAATLGPVDNATIEITPGDFTSITENRSGVYIISAIAAGDYTLDVTAGNLDPASLDVSVGDGQLLSVVIPLTGQKSGGPSCHAALPAAGIGSLAGDLMLAGLLFLVLLTSRRKGRRRGRV